MIISIPGSKIPVHIRDVEFYIVDQLMAEVLLGRPFFLALGFDFDCHLKRMAGDIDGQSMTEIQGGKMAHAGMRYHDEEDPINCPEHLKGRFGEDNPYEISEEFDKILKDVSNNGMSTIGLEKLNELIEDCRFIFRIRLGPD